MYIRPVQYSSWWFSPDGKPPAVVLPRSDLCPCPAIAVLSFLVPESPHNVQGLGYESSPTDTCFSDVKQIPQAMGPFPNPATSDTRWDVRSLGWFVFFVAGRFGKILRQCSEQNTIKPCTRTQRTNQLSLMGLGWLGWLWNEPWKKWGFSWAVLPGFYHHKWNLQR